MKGDGGIPPDLLAAGVGYRQAHAPEHVDLAWLQGECEHLEYTSRMQIRHKGGLPPDREAELGRLPPTNLTRALQRWSYLKHILRTLSEGLSTAAASSDGDRLLLLEKLLVREPVACEMPWGTVRVTDRSYACLVEIARHARRGASLEGRLRRIDAAEEKVAEGIRTETLSVARGRRRLQWLASLRDLVLRELTLQRRAICAHAMTEDGAPARSLDDAPDWWDRVGPLEEALLIEALHRAGAARYAALGPMPEPRERKGGHMEKAEDWAMAGLLAEYDSKIRVDEAPLIQQPLGQVLARIRAGREAEWISDG